MTSQNHHILIDAHAHLWLNQEATVEGKRIRALQNGRAEFMGEERQMMPPYMLDGRNTAEMFLANMDYAQVQAAVITQEYIDGDQSAYLQEISQRYPNRFLCCGLIDARTPGYLARSEALMAQGFSALKLPSGRLRTPTLDIRLTTDEMMQLFHRMEDADCLLSIDLADGTLQVGEMEEVIAECPRLRIAIGHFGMVTREGWQEQIKLARHEHVRIESGGITWLFHDEFYPYPGAIKAIRESIDLVGAEKLMWGSDYPRTMTAITYRMSYDFVLKSTQLTETEKRLFLGENAQAFYRFNHLPELPYIYNMVE